MRTSMGEAERPVMRRSFLWCGHAYNTLQGVGARAHTAPPFSTPQNSLDAATSEGSCESHTNSLLPGHPSLFRQSGSRQPRRVAYRGWQTVLRVDSLGGGTWLPVTIISSSTSCTCRAVHGDSWPSVSLRARGVSGMSVFSTTLHHGLVVHVHAASSAHGQQGASGRQVMQPVPPRHGAGLVLQREASP